MKKDVMEIFNGPNKPTVKDLAEFVREQKSGGVKLKELDRHIILFVKGHYSKYEDVSLTSIFAQWCSLYVSQVETRQVMNMMIRSYERLVKLGVVRIEFENLFGELFAANRRVKGDGGVISPEAIINYIGNVYYDLQINDSHGNNLIELGDIDPQLPIKIKRLMN